MPSQRALIVRIVRWVGPNRQLAFDLCLVTFRRQNRSRDASIYNFERDPLLTKFLQQEKVFSQLEKRNSNEAMVCKLFSHYLLNSNSGSVTLTMTMLSLCDRRMRHKDSFISAGGLVFCLFTSISNFQDFNSQLIAPV